MSCYPPALGGQGRGMASKNRLLRTLSSRCPDGEDGDSTGLSILNRARTAIDVLGWLPVEPPQGAAHAIGLNVNPPAKALTSADSLFTFERAMLRISAIRPSSDHNGRLRTPPPSAPSRDQVRAIGISQA